MNGCEFQAAREYLGLSPTWVAGKLGVDRRTVWKWEHGKSPLPVEAAGLMAEWLDSTAKVVGRLTVSDEPLVAPLDSMTGGHVPPSWGRMVCSRVSERTGREIRWMTSDEWAATVAAQGFSL